VSAAQPGGVVVVDTDVVSFIFKGDSRGDLYRPHVNGQIAVIAAQTRAELELWTLERNWGPRRKRPAPAGASQLRVSPFHGGGLPALGTGTR
jgi:hypothetical protein